MDIIIRKYTPEDENALFSLIEKEGGEWSDYWSVTGKPKYIKALASSVVFLLFSYSVLCGYIRCRDDGGFGVYVFDLLVDRDYRGNDFGRLLIENVCRDYSDNDVYVMGDVYPYYEDNLGYETAGKIYIAGKGD